MPGELHDPALNRDPVTDLKAGGHRPEDVQPLRGPGIIIGAGFELLDKKSALTDSGNGHVLQGNAFSFQGADVSRTLYVVNPGELFPAAGIRQTRGEHQPRREQPLDPDRDHA